MNNINEESTVTMENGAAMEGAQTSKGLAIFYKIQSVCCFTALLSLLGGIAAIGFEVSGVLYDIVLIFILIGMISSLIAAPVMIVKFVFKAALAAGKFGLSLPIIPVNFLLGYAFGFFTLGFLSVSMICCSGVITVYKYFTVLRYV